MYQEYLNFAKEIALYAKEIMLKYFNEESKESYKNDNTIVTIADTKINKYLIDRVKEKYKTHSVDGEEDKFGKSNYVWVCDPIDGTAMYARNIKTATFSLALVVDGEPVVAVVYDPFSDSLYHAIKGEGAYKNNQPINVNNIKLNDKKSVSHYDMWPSSKYNIYDTIKELGKSTYFVSIGSVVRASMCIAEGNFNLVIFPGTNGKNCDIAASKLIVEEANGKVTDIFGKEQRYDQDINGAVLSNGLIHEEVISILKKNLQGE